MREYKNVKDIIKFAHDKKFKICIWGAGYLGKTLGYNILKQLDIVPDYYCDNNEKLWGKEVQDGIFCVDYHRLLKEKEKIIWFVFIGTLHIDAVVEQLLQMQIFNFVTFAEIISFPEVQYSFFPFMNKKTVAYTCITGGYDDLQEPYNEIQNDYDYYLISDKQPPRESIYKWIDIKDVIPNQELDLTRKNRYCKINAHKMFPEYRRSIYYDGNIILKRNMDHLFDELKKTRVGVASPYKYNGIYKEALDLLPQRRDNPELIYTQIKKYWIEGMPESYGSFWCNVLIREHNNPICIKLMEEWWNEVETQSNRDQLSFPYVMWKNNYGEEDILVLSDATNKSPYWEFINEHNISRLANAKLKF